MFPFFWQPSHALVFTASKNEHSTIHFQRVIPLILPFFHICTVVFCRFRIFKYILNRMTDGSGLPVSDITSLPVGCQPPLFFYVFLITYDGFSHFLSLECLNLSKKNVPIAKDIPNIQIQKQSLRCFHPRGRSPSPVVFDTSHPFSLLRYLVFKVS